MFSKRLLLERAIQRVGNNLQLTNFKRGTTHIEIQKLSRGFLTVKNAKTLNSDSLLDFKTITSKKIFSEDKGKSLGKKSAQSNYEVFSPSDLEILQNLMASINPAFAEDEFKSVLAVFEVYLEYLQQHPRSGCKDGGFEVLAGPRNWSQRKPQDVYV